MNRTLRAPEARAPPRTLGAVIKEKDEELALFLEMRRREKERSDSLLLIDTPDDLDRPAGSKPGSSPIFKIVPTAAPPRKTAVDDFLSSDGEKNDYDWLLTPPGTPLFPSLEKEPRRSPASLDGTPKSRQTALKSRLANPSDPLSRGSSLTKVSAAKSGTNSSGSGIRRPSSSGGSGSVSSRLSGGSASVSSRLSGSGPASVSSRLSGGSGSASTRLSGGLNSSSRPPGGLSGGPSSASRPSSRPATPTSRSTLPSTSKSSRPATPTSRASVPAKPAPGPRSATPTRSSTPTSRASLAPPSSRPSSRASTPTRRPSTSSSVTNNNTGPLVRPPSATKAAAVASKANAPPPRSSSPSVRSRSWKPSEMPGFSLDAPPNLRTSLPDRPSSATRGRPGAPSSRSSSVEPGPVSRPRRQSCSPSRGRAPNGTNPSGSSVPAVSRSRVNGSDNVSSVMVGNKMVERVVNSRRLAPPRQDNRRSSHISTGKTSSSPDRSSFGRTLSKKSLDMALRHMDIRQSIPNNLRPLMTNVPASSMYSVRSGPARSRAFSASDSPLATSSNCSSEQSVNNNHFFLEGSEVGDEDIRIER